MVPDWLLNFSKINIQVQFDVDLPQRCDCVIWSWQHEYCTVSSLNSSNTWQLDLTCLKSVNVDLSIQVFLSLTSCPSSQALTSPSKKSPETNENWSCKLSGTPLILEHEKKQVLFHMIDPPAMTLCVYLKVKEIQARYFLYCTENWLQCWLEAHNGAYWRQWSVQLLQRPCE